MEHTGKIMLIMTYNDPLVVAKVVANKKTGELTPARYDYLLTSSCSISFANLR